MTSSARWDSSPRRPSPSAGPDVGGRAPRRRPGPGAGGLRPPRRPRRLVRGDAGALGRRRVRGPRAHLHQRRQGHDGPATSTPTCWPGGGPTRRPRRRSFSASPANTSSAIRDGELVDDAALRATLVRLGPQAPPAHRPRARPHRRVLRRGLLQPPRPPDHGLRPARRPVAGRGAARTTSPRPAPAYQVQTALLSGTLEPTVWVDVTATIEDKVAAVSCHRSQFADGGEWAGRAVRERAQEDGRRAGVAYAEGFRRLRLGG